MTEAAPLWRPSEERIARSNLRRFIAQVNAGSGLQLETYPELYAWSLRDPARFWKALASFAEVKAEWGQGPVCTPAAPPKGAKWFSGTRLNYAENLLRFRDDAEALVFANERGARRSLTYRQLAAEVARIASGLRAAGVTAGDRVAGLAPNLPETAIAMIAAASVGAIWSSCSPDFGIRGVLDRLGQVGPKVLFCADGYIHARKRIDCLGQLAAVIRSLPTLERAVVVPYISEAPDLGAVPGVETFARFGTVGAALEFTQTDFDHPLFILYSSGTTGAPKCIVHGVGGTLLQHQKEHLLHTDLTRADRLFYFTTCGWMMWNWLMSGLACGATLVLYDGSPFHPDPGVLWRLAEEERITVFGTSAKYLQAMQRADYRPSHEVNLTALRAILSTGSPLLPESFDFVYRDIKPDVLLSSISGGTDIISCFALGTPLLPVYRGEIQCRGLGMAVEVFDEAGRSVRGEKGELVCTAPFPSMPLGFWNDPAGVKYHAAYFERFPGVWHHGDHAELTVHDGLVIYGRSDAVLNPGGVRIGTAEIYSAVDRLPEVIDSIAVGQEWRGDVRVVLFVCLRPGTELDKELRKKICAAIRADTTPHHVPSKVLAVPEIPRTLSGKLVEITVRNVIHGLPAQNVEALANPQALEYFRNRPELLRV